MNEAFKNQRSLKSVVKQHKEQAAQPKPVEPTPQKPIARPEQAAKAKKVKLPIPEKPKYQCGHDIQLRDLMNSPCKACLGKQRDEKNDKLREKRIAKGQNVYPIPNSEKWGRLPHGTSKSIQYIEDLKWKGEMRVPGDEGTTVVFEAEGRSELTCCWNLDNLYRKYLQEKVAKEFREKEAKKKEEQANEQAKT